MSNIAIILQLVIALGIVNVWIIRRDRATGFRPDGAANIHEVGACPAHARNVDGGARSSARMTTLFVHLTATAFMAGLIVFVQVVHAQVGDASFGRYEQAHTTRTRLGDEVTPDDLRAAMGFASWSQADNNHE